MERVANVPFHIAGIDARQAHDPLLAEKRGRERAILTAYGVCLLAWIMAYLTSAAASSSGGGPGEVLWSILQVVRLAALGTGAMAALSGVWMLGAYLGFRRRNVAVGR